MNSCIFIILSFVSIVVLYKIICKVRMTPQRKQLLSKYFKIKQEIEVLMKEEKVAFGLDFEKKGTRHLYYIYKPYFNKICIRLDNYLTMFSGGFSKIENSSDVEIAAFIDSKHIIIALITNKIKERRAQEKKKIEDNNNLIQKVLNKN